MTRDEIKLYYKNICKKIENCDATTARLLVDKIYPISWYVLVGVALFVMAEH